MYRAKLNVNITKVMSQPQDALYISRALQLARLGFGATAPNPMVGCVIVKEGRIIGEGLHRAYGGPHAEVNAVADCVDKYGSEADVEGSTVYVTLEPCSHFGKTPPCADLLIRLRPARVVMASLDVNPVVRGNGLERLRAAGIECVVGVLEQEAIDLNRRFWTNQLEKRAYAIGKWAQSADGFMDRGDGKQSWLTGPEARQLVHQWRSQEAAVLVGYHTARIDNPSLTVREWPGRNPVRVVVDRDASLPTDLNLFKEDGARVIVLTQSEQKPLGHVQYIQLNEDQFHSRGWLEALYSEAGIASVLVEGGAKLLAAWDQAVLDEARIFTAPVVWGQGSKAPQVALPLMDSQAVGEDRLEVRKVSPTPNPDLWSVPSPSRAW